MRILIIEDDDLMSKALKERLGSSYAIDLAPTGKRGLELSQVTDYDLILLDLCLPDIHGRTVCELIRKDGLAVPVLILTAQSTSQDVVTLLDTGADDYIIKPFNLAELEARIRALLRRPTHTYLSEKLNISDLLINTETRVAERNRETLALRRKEFDILAYLVRNKGRVVTREMLIEHVWDETVDPFTNVVDVHIKHLRDKVDKPFSTKLIQTVHGLGYKIGE